MAGHVSPDIRNYLVGKGIVSFMRDGESTWRDLGNCPTFEFTPTVETLDHFSSRQGVKTKDRKVVLSKSGSLKIVMEEFTAENLAIALLGDASVNSLAQDEIDIFALSEVKGQIKFVGTNDIGPKWTYIFPIVSFIPSAAISPLSDAWGNMEVSGEVTASETGSFGTATKTADEA